LDGKSTQSGLGRYANSCRAQDKRDGLCSGNNGKIVVDTKNKSARLKATRGIEEGTEMYISYGKKYWSGT
jgi:hypothetical protein